MLKFIHAADIHLDSPMLGLKRYDGAPIDEVRLATRQALENLVNVAIDEQVGLVLIAGDIYDGNWRDSNTGLYFIKEMRRLAEAGIQVVTIKGNHDAASVISKSLPLPENVTTLSERKPETHVIEHLGIAVHGQSFATRDVAADLSLAYPSPVPGCFNIGLLHTCADGRDGHDRYAPCSIAGLRNKGYDYWALGHVHTREELSTDPWISFSGNVQGRSIRETGSKGVNIVSVSELTDVAVEHRSLDTVRWQRICVDTTPEDSLDDILGKTDQRLSEQLADIESRVLAARVEITGRSPAIREMAADSDRWADQIRAMSLSSGSGQIWIEKLKVLPRSIEAVAADTNDSGNAVQILAMVRLQAAQTDAMKTYAAEFADLRNKIPAAMRTEQHDFRPDDPAYLADLIPEIDQIISSRLLDKN